MQASDRKAATYFGILILYIGLGSLLEWLGIERGMRLGIELAVVGGVLWWQRAQFTFRLRWDWLAVSVGVLIAGLWTVLSIYTPAIGKGAAETVAAYTGIEIVLKILRGVVLAAIIEEFITRYFLHRFLQDKKWEKVPLGTYELLPFVVTTLFFGLAHNEWAAGLVTGAILNWLWYRKKDMNSIVVAHGIANLVLGLIVSILGLWSLWG